MALRGTLGDFSLTDILQLIGLQRKTGILMLRHGDEEITVGFENGRVVSAESSLRPGEQRIGQLLIRRGKLSAQRLDEALRLQKETLSRLGHVLVERKWVDPTVLRRQLRSQICETVFSMFRWHGGEYDFQPRERVEWDREYVDPVPAEHLLMEGARMVDEWPIIERVIPDQYVVLRPTRSAARVLAAAGDGQESKGSIYDQDIDFGFIPTDPLAENESRPRLSPSETQVLRWIDGKRPAYEVAELTELGVFETFKTMARLVEMKLVEQIAVDSEVEAAPGQRRPRLFQTAGSARVAAIGLALAALIGAFATINPFLVWLGWRSPILPSLQAPAAPSQALEQVASLGRFATIRDAARLNRIEQALQVYYLDTTEWPRRLSDLVDQGLLANEELSDAWGIPYGYELYIWGYRITRAGDDGRRPAERERRFSPLQQAISAPGPEGER
jgi:hypothetical protein